jgi:pimeloyl-ACP methyl ester carboxylesterase
VSLEFPDAEDALEWICRLQHFDLGDTAVENHVLSRQHQHEAFGLVLREERNGAVGQETAEVDKAVAAVLSSARSDPYIVTQPPPLLLLPGLACDAEVWKRQARSLAEITSIAIADYGMSDSLAEMARAALARAPERFAVAGHSMGGRVAFEILRRAPGRVAGLALLDTACRELPAGEAGERERAGRLAFLNIARSQGMRAMSRRWVQNMVHPTRLSDEPLIEAIVEMMGRKTPETYAAQIKALLDRRDATPVLAATRCPTVVICGREDAWSLLSGHREMAALVPRSKLVVIERCGHMAPMERPGEVTAALAEWLEWVAREGSSRC